MRTVSKTYGTKQCANCGETFIARRINMIYCTDQCCKTATNAKLIASYHSKKQLKNIPRDCSSCGARLSRYNKDITCNSCKNRDESKKRKELLEQLGINYIDEEFDK